MLGGGMGLGSVAAPITPKWAGSIGDRVKGWTWVCPEVAIADGSEAEPKSL